MILFTRNQLRNFIINKKRIHILINRRNYRASILCLSINTHEKLHAVGDRELKTKTRGYREKRITKELLNRNNVASSTLSPVKISLR